MKDLIQEEPSDSDKFQETAEKKFLQFSWRILVTSKSKDLMVSGWLSWWLTSAEGRNLMVRETLNLQYA